MLSYDSARSNILQSDTVCSASDFVDSRTELMKEWMDCGVIVCASWSLAIDSCANVSVSLSRWLNDAETTDCAVAWARSCSAIEGSFKGVSSWSFSEITEWSSPCGFNKCLSTSCYNLNRSKSSSSCLLLILRLNWFTLDLSSSSKTTDSFLEY